MKKSLLKKVPSLLTAMLMLSVMACSQEVQVEEASIPVTVQTDKEGIQWMSIEAALSAQKENPKPIFVDVYTDWCGWCKVMDKKTFSQEEVASYLNDHFYPVKFNAEKEKPIELNGQQYEVVNAGKRGIHTLAYAMLDGRLSYPSYVILGGDMQRLGVIKGFKEADPFLSMLEDYQNKQ
ncbi:MAG: DUF255 domain-containing protein [Chitinophagales bacterium]|nr:DUF255 domain-containing protein [Chitinophagales bacterium]